jgi:hypothetical protein
MGDPHFGMYAWAADAGADFDLNIAERLTCAAIDRLVASGPAAGTALLLNLGDMFHADNQRNQTNSGHQLDVDGRWAKVQKVGLMAMIHCIKRLLEKYPRVIFRINKGNHDGHSSYALALMLSCYFHNEPRVEVDLSPAVAWYYRFGKVLIGSTHGDTIKGKDMLSVMAADKPEEWGQTKHRHWYVGHVHHHDSKEYHGGTVEYFRTLASRDAWHQGQGYRAGRDMCMIVHHREHGEIERHRCDVGMLAAPIRLPPFPPALPQQGPPNPAESGTIPARINDLRERQAPESQLSPRTTDESHRLAVSTCCRYGARDRRSCLHRTPSRTPSAARRRPASTSTATGCTCM